MHACTHALVDVPQDMSAEEASALQELVHETRQQVDAVEAWCLAHADCQLAVRHLLPRSLAPAASAACCVLLPPLTASCMTRLCHSPSASYLPGVCVCSCVTTD
jgi:hypothetical protein